MDLCYAEKRFQNLAKITKRCQPCRARLVCALYFHDRCFWVNMCSFEKALRKQTLYTANLQPLLISCLISFRVIFWVPVGCWNHRPCPLRRGELLDCLLRLDEPKQPVFLGQICLSTSAFKERISCLDGSVSPANGGKRLTPFVEDQSFFFVR